MIYEDFKKNLLEQLRTKRDIIIAEKKFDEPSSLLEISENLDLYTEIVVSFKRINERAFSRLLNDLAKKYSVDLYNEFPIGRFRCDYVIVDEGLENIIEVKSMPRGNINFPVLKLANELNKPLILVFLIKDDINGQNAILKIHNEIVEKWPEIDVKCMTFGMLVDYFFGTDEFLKFQNAMSTFKDEAHKIIGFQLTEVFNEDNLLKLKNETKCELLEFPYDDFRCLKNARFDIDQNNFDLIKNNFLNERYKIVLGKKDFAESFLTSEWLYKNYVKSNEMDNTFIVAGYLKSIEQLLWDILLLIEDEDKFKETNPRTGEDIIRNTLGNLEYFISNYYNKGIYGEIFGHDVRIVQKYLKEIIKHWRINHRNGYFHKDNLNDVNKIKTIRKETYFLYMLIIGSIDLSNDNLERLEC